MKGDRKFAPLFEVIQIDACAEGEDEWTWNNQYKLFQFRTESLDVKRVFLRRFRKFLAEGVTTISGIREYADLGRGWYYVDGDWSMLELKKRCNDEPVYACIRLTPS